MFEFKAGDQVGYGHNKPVAHITHTMSRNDIISLLTIAGKAYGQEDLKCMLMASPLGGQIISDIEHAVKNAEAEADAQANTVKHLKMENAAIYQQLEHTKAELERAKYGASVVVHESGHFDSPSVIVNRQLRAELEAVKTMLRNVNEDNVRLRAQLQEANDEATKYRTMATQEVIEMSRKLTQGIGPEGIHGKFYCTVEGGKAPKVEHSDSLTALIEAKRLAISLNARVRVTKLVYTVRPIHGKESQRR